VRWSILSQINFLLSITSTDNVIDSKSPGFYYALGQLGPINVSRLSKITPSKMRDYLIDRINFEPSTGKQEINSHT